MAKKLTRRNFLKGAGAAAIASQLKTPFHTHNPNYTLAASKLNIAAVGSGGKGRADTHGCKHENIVALSDVDFGRAAETFNEFPKAKQYKDFRDMLDKHPEIDGVTVSTPDHFHAYAADYAMRQGKHVYVQKPLTYSIGEARHLTLTATETGVITQMGNQGHAGDGVRDMCEIIWDGIIGDVTEAHIWTNRPVWPQGIARPTTVDPIPETLDWDLWQGPAPRRDFNKIYLPFNWRGWKDYGAGALGDMACHIADPANWALRLSSVGPDSVELLSSKNNNDDTFPSSAKMRYEFPARGSQPAFTLYWYDGGNKPALPKGCGDDISFGDGDDGIGSNGTIFVGTEGYATCETYGDRPRVYTKNGKVMDYKKPEQFIPRVPNGPYQEWTDSIKSGQKPGSNFDYSGPFTEWVVMGNLSLSFPGQKLEWDAANMRVTNNKAANKLVMRDYKNGYKLGKLAKLPKIG
jgi:predicted dehydrogenase